MPRDALYLAAVLVLYAVLIVTAIHRGSTDGAGRARAPWEVGWTAFPNR